MSLPDHNTIVKLVMDTMTYYGSNAGEKANPGSKLKGQAQHIADVLIQYDTAIERTANLPNITVQVRA